MKQFIANHIKNISGWKTQRKILCFAVDDYGNIYLKSPESFEKLKTDGINLSGRFDEYDALDTTEDFEQLFEVLNSVKDQHHNPAIFTTYALPANINFEKVLSKKDKFYYELLPETYKKLAAEDLAYKGAMELLYEGINSKFIKPQFHGREHLNLELFESYLKDKNPTLLANLKYHSYTSIPKLKDKPTISYNQSFAFWKESETDRHKSIISDGLRCFEKVYGFQPKTFTPPAQQLHPKLYPFLEELGIKSIDKPRKAKRHLGENNFVNERNVLGIQKHENHVTIVRNAVFEPNANKNIDWVDFTFKQIQAAFRMNKPAIISSHRINFCGRIKPNNRKEGLQILKSLLCKVVQKYPDVEFLAVDELTDEIIRTSPKNHI